MKEGETIELYMPLTSTIVLKREKQQGSTVFASEFRNSLNKDASSDSRAYVSPVSQNEVDEINQQAPNIILKSDDNPNFQIQVANGHVEKPLSTATPKFDIWDKAFAEHFVVMKKCTRPIIGFHFMKHNSVVIDTTQCLIHFIYLTKQVKSSASEKSVKLRGDFNGETLTELPMIKKTNTASVDHPCEGNKAGILIWLEKFTVVVSDLLIFHSLSTIIDKKVAITVTSTTDWP